MGRRARRALVFGLVLVAALATAGRLGPSARWLSAEYLYRYVVWGPVFFIREARGIDPLIDESDRYPVRTIEIAPPAFHFAANPGLTMPATVAYRDGDRTVRDDLASFLTSTGSTSFIVVKDGALVYERYLNGHQRDSPCVSQSVAKSFTSALIGIAIDDGHIKSVDDPVTRYLPELEPNGFGAVTLRDLLTMGSGLDYTRNHFPWDDEPLFTLSPNLRALVVTMTLHEPPGRSFLYNNYNTVLLGMILERATHRTPSQLLQEQLWQPLGMEFSASWCLDGDHDQFELMANGINARAIDYAKLGQLYLNDGDWNGKQIVPKHWVRESTTENPDDRRPWRILSEWKDIGGYYKYHWWGIARGRNDYAFTAIGAHGQFIYVYPKRGLVIVRTGDRWGIASFMWPQVFQAIADGIR